MRYLDLVIRQHERRPGEALRQWLLPLATIDGLVKRAIRSIGFECVELHSEEAPDWERLDE